MAKRLTIAAAALAIGGSVAFATSPQTDVANRANDMIDDKIEASKPTVVRRIRALYRLSREPDHLFAVSSRDRQAMASNLEWMLRRDLEPLAALRAERANVEAERLELIAARQPTAAPAIKLRNPVAGSTRIYGFGQRIHANKPVSSRGVALRVTPGADVVAPIAGKVVYAGAALGETMVVLEQGDVWVVVYPVSSALSIGDRVERGEALGNCPSDQILVELRLADDRGGLPVDPGRLTVD